LSSVAKSCAKQFFNRCDKQSVKPYQREQDTSYPITPRPINPATRLEAALLKMIEDPHSWIDPSFIIASSIN
jgi:hypothetical protein